MAEKSMDSSHGIEQRQHGPRSWVMGEATGAGLDGFPGGVARQFAGIVEMI